MDDKSGGVATNIGVHFFDMLHFIFGDIRQNEVHFRDRKTASGYLEYDKARVKWFLSIDANHLENAVNGEKHLSKYNHREKSWVFGWIYRSPHDYKKILSGNGFDVGIIVLLSKQSKSFVLQKSLKTLRFHIRY